MTLNQEQRQAVYSDAKKILCLAGAGTGKTHTMINRISSLVDDKAVSVARILVLTFTNAAAAEMEGRYRKNHTATMAPKFATFHAFCYSLIVEQPEIMKAIGYSQVPDLLDDENRKLIDKTIRQTLNLKISQSKIAGKGILSAQEQFEYNLYWKSFKKELFARNLITFDIMCNDVCKLFEDDADCVEPIKQRYKYIFVDEFQDTDPIQWRFLQSFPEDANIFVVGDVKQAIYAFRGADSSIIKSIAKDPEWEVIKLVQNYRSTVEICNYANQIGDKDPSYNLDLVSTRNGAMVAEGVGDVERYNSDLYQQVSGFIEFAACVNENVAILVRTNAEVDIICDMLQQNKIAYSTNAKPTDSINILRSCLSPEFELSWLASLLPSEKYSSFIRLKSTNPEYSTADLIQTFGQYWAISKRFSAITEVLAIAKDSKLFPYQRIAKIVELLNLPETIIDFNQTNPEDILKYCLDIAQDSSGSPEGTAQIYVGTIHSSKGLEYDSVLLLGVGGKTFRLTNEENLNLYYVGCTRAKNHLKVVKGIKTWDM